MIDRLEVQHGADEKNSVKRFRPENRLGFTLIEITLVVAILGILAISVLLFMKPAVDLMVRQTFVEGQANEARLAILLMVREINQLKDAQSISTANANQFSFTDANNQAVSYTLSSGVLKRNNVPLAGGVTALQFTYWDVNNSQLTTPTISPATNIVRVQISLTVAANGQTATFRSQARPRNLST
ncbi:MAG: type II secretion system protein [Candidatus Omnitrophica bacterium]|nr:type II secretion system protein [Candidatus Omnitrophota bacterium]MDD5670110.1 type II secretion system protein [Candidatus Omnitrophota bacterium]